MLKKTISIITLILLCFAVAAVSYGEGCFYADGQELTLGSLQEIDSALLNALERGKRESDRAFLTLTYDGFDLPVYDAKSGVLLFCKQLSNDISIEKNISCDIRTAADANGVTIFAYDNASFRAYRVEWTTLPIVCLQSISLPKAKTIDRDLVRGLVTVFDNASGNAQQLPVTLRTRGQSSLQYPKAGYLMKFIDQQTGGETSASLLGLSENTEYTLNSLYEDNTKIRDFASLSLWSSIRNTGRDTAHAYMIDFVYAEVFINGAYAGLYGFQENVNLASFGLANAKSISLFMPDSHRVPSLKTAPVSGEVWDDIQLEETTQETPWALLKEAVDQIFYRADAASRGELFDVLDRESCVDYFIWCNLLYASDNLWKNMLLIADQRDPANETIFLAPWDSDQSFGLVWDSSMPRSVYEDAARANLPLIEKGPLPLGKLWEDDVGGFRAEVAARWFALRQSVLREDVLRSFLGETFTLVTQSGARGRDAMRWPQSATCADNAFIESFMQKRLAYLDAYYAHYR